MYKLRNNASADKMWIMMIFTSKMKRNVRVKKMFGSECISWPVFFKVIVIICLKVWNHQGDRVKQVTTNGLNQGILSSTVAMERLQHLLRETRSSVLYVLNHHYVTAYCHFMESIFLYILHGSTVQRIVLVTPLY